MLYRDWPPNNNQPGWKSVACSMISLSLSSLCLSLQVCRLETENRYIFEMSLLLIHPRPSSANTFDKTFKDFFALNESQTGHMMKIERIQTKCITLGQVGRAVVASNSRGPGLNPGLFANNGWNMKFKKKCPGMANRKTLTISLNSEFCKLWVFNIFWGRKQRSGTYQTFCEI